MKLKKCIFTFLYNRQRKKEEEDRRKQREDKNKMKETKLVEQTQKIQQEKEAAKLYQQWLNRKVCGNIISF